MKNFLAYVLFIFLSALSVLLPIYYFRDQITQYFYLHRVDHPLPGIDYDLIVVGSDPEGIAAAVQAAKLGLKTLLIDSHDQVGGLFTDGGLAMLDLNYDAEGRKIVSNSAFTDFLSGVNAITYGQPSLYANAFDVNDALSYFNMIIAEEENLTLILAAEDIRPTVSSKLLTGIQYRINGQIKSLSSQIVIDATPDGDIAALCGCPFTFGMEDAGFKYYFQAPTLVFYLGGIDWDDLKKDLDRDIGLVYNNACTIYHDVMRSYQPHDPYIRFRGLNIAQQRNDAVAVNGMLLFKVNPLNEKSKQEALARGALEAELVSEYIKKTIPGFENAYFQGVAKTLYIRETRHIVTEYTLSIIDCLANRDFADKIALVTYPLDMQPRFLSDFPDGQVFGNPAQYSIPIRSIVPKVMDNLLIVGRSAGYSSLAHSSARVVAPGMDEGQAAAYLAMVSIVEKITPREAIRDHRRVTAIQKLLHKDGRYLQPFSYPSGITAFLGNRGVITAVKAGIVPLGYRNDYEILNRPAANIDLVINSIGKYILRDQFTAKNPAKIYNTDNQIILQLLLQSAPKLKILTSYEMLLERQIISQATYEQIVVHNPMRSQDLYNLCYEVFSYLQQTAPDQ